MPFLNVMLLVTCVSLVLCHNQRDIWIKHNGVASEESFPCKVPQPRVFYVEDLIEEKEWNERYEAEKDNIMPYATVLYRCESTGCCNKRKERCLPLESKNVNLTFAIGHKPLDYFEVQAQNHTECRCQKKT